MFALVAALQISAALPVDERGHLLPQDNVAAAPARIAAACPREHGELRDALLRDEARLAQRLAGTARQPDTAWLQLACLRATLFVDGATGREGLLMPLGTGWSHGAIEVLLRAIAQTPQGPTAARLLTAVALAAQQTSLPAVATFSENARGSREPWAPIANAVFAAVRAGVVDSAVYRGCTSYLLDIGDFAAARTCSSRALEHGADSTWHMLRLAYIAFHVADTLGGTRFFRDAAAVANTVAARSELSWHLDYRMAWASRPGRARLYVDSLRPAELAEWLAQSDSTQRAGLMARHWARVQAAAHRSIGAILTDHFWSVTYARGSFHDCIATLVTGVSATTPGEDRDLPCAPKVAQDLHTIPMAASMYRLWDADGKRVHAHVVYGIPVRELVSSDDQGSTPITLQVRLWDSVANHWVDTTFDGSFQSGSHPARPDIVHGALAFPASGGVTFWDLTASQSQNRFGVVAGDDRAPLGPPSFSISDVVVGAPHQGLLTVINGDTVALMPMGAAAPNDPLQLFFQVRSDQARPQVTTTLAVFATSKHVISARPALQLSYSGALRAGLTAVQRGLDVSRFHPGTYQLNVMISVPGGATASQHATVVLH